MKFAINDKVAAIDEAIDGIVVAIKDKIISVETPDGFEMQFREDQLVKTTGTAMHFKGISHAISQKDNFKKRPKNAPKPKERNAPTIVFDLHIEKLVKSKKGMSNFEILSLQLDTAKKQLDFAIRKRMQKIVLVHGVGEGVLKADLYSMLRRYDNIKFYDADYVKYGQGATEIYIFQNVPT